MFLKRFRHNIAALYIVIHILKDTTARKSYCTVAVACFMAGCFTHSLFQWLASSWISPFLPILVLGMPYNTHRYELETTSFTGEPSTVITVTSEDPASEDSESDMTIGSSLDIVSWKKASQLTQKQDS